MTSYIDPAFRESLLKKPHDRTAQVSKILIFFFVNIIISNTHTHTQQPFSYLFLLKFN